METHDAKQPETTTQKPDASSGTGESSVLEELLDLKVTPDVKKPDASSEHQQTAADTKADKTETAGTKPAVTDQTKEQKPDGTPTEIKTDKTADAEPEINKDASKQTAADFAALRERNRVKQEKLKADFEAQIVAQRKEYEDKLSKAGGEKTAPTQQGQVVLPPDAVARLEAIRAKHAEAMKAENATLAAELAADFNTTLAEERAVVRVRAERQSEQASQQQAQQEREFTAHVHWLTAKIGRVEDRGPQFAVLDENRKVIPNEFTKAIAAAMDKDRAKPTLENLALYAAEVQADVLSGELTLEKAKVKQAGAEAQVALQQTALSTSTKSSASRPTTQNQDPNSIEALSARADKGDKAAIRELARREMAGTA